MYVIATDSRQRDEVLFMVNRKLQRASFWSNRLDDAMVYADKNAADAKAASFRFNRPRALPLSEARKIEVQQENERINDEAMAESEMGWDAHKDYF